MEKNKIGYFCTTVIYFLSNRVRSFTEPSVDEQSHEREDVGQGPFPWHGERLALCYL